MQNFVRQWTKKSTGQCVRWFEKSTGQFKKPPAFVRFPVLNTTPAHKVTHIDFNADEIHLKPIFIVTNYVYTNILVIRT